MTLCKAIKTKPINFFQNNDDSDDNPNVDSSSSVESWSRRRRRRQRRPSSSSSDTSDRRFDQRRASFDDADVSRRYFSSSYSSDDASLDSSSSTETQSTERRTIFLRNQRCLDSFLFGGNFGSEPWVGCYSTEEAFSLLIGLSLIRIFVCELRRSIQFVKYHATAVSHVEWETWISVPKILSAESRMTACLF